MKIKEGSEKNRGSYCWHRSCRKEGRKAMKMTERRKEGREKKMEKKGRKEGDRRKQEERKEYIRMTVEEPPSKRATLKIDLFGIPKSIFCVDIKNTSEYDTRSPPSKRALSKKKMHNLEEPPLSSNSRQMSSKKTFTQAKCCFWFG